MVVEEFVVFELFFADLLSKDGPDDLLLLLLFDADLLIEEDSDDLLLLLLFDASLRLLISEDLSVEAVLLSLLPPFYQPAQF